GIMTSWTSGSHQMDLMGRQVPGSGDSTDRRFWMQEEGWFPKSHRTRFADPPMANEVAKGSPAASVIAEEERLFGQVQARVAMGDEPEEGRPKVGASDLDADLLSLRDQIA